MIGMVGRGEGATVANVWRLLGREGRRVRLWSPQADGTEVPVEVRRVELRHGPVRLLRATVSESVGPIVAAGDLLLLGPAGRSVLGAAGPGWPVHHARGVRAVIDGIEEVEVRVAFEIFLRRPAVVWLGGAACLIGGAT